jgi:hypothetical protein
VQQGQGGIGSRKHGISGRASQSPRFRLMQQLAAERGELDGTPAPARRKRLRFVSVRDALAANRSTAKAGRL